MRGAYSSGRRVGQDDDESDLLSGFWLERESDGPIVTGVGAATLASSPPASANEAASAAAANQGHSFEEEIEFISGVTNGGLVGDIAYRTWDRATGYNQDTSQVFKWGSSIAGTSSGTLSYYFEPGANWTEGERGWFRAAFAMWAEVANVTFAETSEILSANVWLRRGDDGRAFSNAIGEGTSIGQPFLGDPTRTIGNVISIDTSTQSFGPITDLNAKAGYPISTLVHEIGHFLGLGHGGPYNGNYTASQVFGDFDHRRWATMSYVQDDPDEWGIVGGIDRAPHGWMPLDILAIQRLYGATASTQFSGGDTFGFNTTITGAVRPFFDFTQNQTPVITIYSTGTNNTLDVSGFADNAEISLFALSHSSVAGITRNIAIAQDTIVENAIGGSGSDRILGNFHGNHLYGGAGNDYLYSYSGNDYLYGESGNDELFGREDVDRLYGGLDQDTLWGGTGGDFLYGESGNDTLHGEDDGDYLSGSSGLDTLNGGNGADTLYGGDDADLLRGENDDDTLWGGNGDDQLHGMAGNDYLVGEIGHDTLTGDVGNDTMNGGSGDDRLYGQADNDTLVGDFGRDTLDGGAGQDTMTGGADDDTYYVDVAGDRIVEATGGGTDTVLSSISYTLGANVENLTLTGSAYSGYGNELGNVITGSSGSNYLRGNQGYDTLQGGLGDDTYILYDTTPRQVLVIGGPPTTVALADIVVEGSLGGNDTVYVMPLFEDGYGFTSYTIASNVERAIVAGTSRFDVYGNSQSNYISGNGGDNILEGRVGNDTLISGGGQDTLRGGVGDDLYRMTAFYESPFGGTTYAYLFGYVQEETGLDTLEIATTSANQLVYAVASELETVRVVTSQSVRLIGNASDNLFVGNNRADRLEGAAGRDTLDGGLGLDGLFGGTGDDTYVIADSTQFWVVDDTYFLQDAVNENAGEGTDTVRLRYLMSDNTYTLSANVENLMLEVGQAARLVGNGLGNVITGNSAGDRLEGGAGNDTLTGGLSDDGLFGGAGDDTYVIADRTQHWVVDDSYFTQDSVVENAGEGTDTVRLRVLLDDGTYALSANVENLVLEVGQAARLVGNGLGNAISGNIAADRLEGGGGNDTLDGGGGSDRLDGGEGDDILRGGAGADAHVGGVGIDMATYYSSTGVTVSLDGTLAGTGDAASDTFSLVEGLRGSASGNDVLRGNAVGNTLEGLGGNDRLEGLGGNDTLAGGAGADALIGGTGTDAADYRASSGVVVSLDGTLTATGEAVGDTFAQIESLLGSLTGADHLRGSAGNETLWGYGGNDRLEGGNGDDTLDGGLGADTLLGGWGADDFSFTAALGGGNVDTIVGFERGTDDFVLNRWTFAGIGPTLDANEFGSSADPDNFIIYDRSTGQLFYDAWGSTWGSPPPVLFATVPVGTVLGIGDFVMV